MLRHGPTLCVESDEFLSVVALMSGQLAFSRAQIDWAETVFRRGSSTTMDERQHATDFLNAWRAAHQGPLARFRPMLEERANELDPRSVVVSRLKRNPTILGKLLRFPKLALWNYQDIGGVRAVLHTPLDVATLADGLMENPPSGFQFQRADNYLTRSPKKSGYGGIHLIYSYIAQSPEEEPLHGLHIEVQLRTLLQHAWATTNEIVGVCSKQDLKFGQGSPDWLRFFELAGNVMAAGERLPTGRNVPKSFDDLLAELRDVNQKLRAVERIVAWSLAPTITDNPGAQGQRHFVLTYDLDARHLGIEWFPPGDFAKADAAYRAKEQAHRGDLRYDTVLVSAESLEEVKQGLPNYYADSGTFLDIILAALLPWTPPPIQREPK